MLLKGNDRGSPVTLLTLCPACMACLGGGGDQEKKVEISLPEAILKYDLRKNVLSPFHVCTWVFCCGVR